MNCAEWSSILLNLIESINAGVVSNMFAIPVDTRKSISSMRRGRDRLKSIEYVKIVNMIFHLSTILLQRYACLELVRDAVGKK